MQEKQTTSLKVKNSNAKGITLIALVITIIVMLILVGVTISTALNGGLIGRTKEAADKTQNAIEVENALANGRIKINSTWYDSIDDYLNNNPSENQGNSEDEPPQGVIVAGVPMDGNIYEFRDLQEAIDFAAESDLSVYIINDYELKQDINIPANVQVIIGNGKVESYEPTNEVKTFGNLTVNSKITVSGKLYVLPWVETKDGKARSLSDIQTRNLTVGPNGSISTEGEGEFKDCSRVSGAPIVAMDYVNYPKDYENVDTYDPTDETKTKTAKSTFTGWRAVANYVKDEKKIVKIVTAGIPEVVTVTEADFAEDNLNGPYTSAVVMGNGYELKNLNECGKKYFDSKYADSYSVLGTQECDWLYSNRRL